MKSINLHRVFVAVGLTGLVIIYIMLWVRMITTPAERTGSDFISSYAGGRVADLWGGTNVYNLDYQQRVQEQVLGFDVSSNQVLIFIHPPFLVPLLSLLMDANYLASLGRYAILMALIYAVGMAVACRLLVLDSWERAQTWLILAGMTTFFPLFVSLLNTQDTAILLLGGLLWLLGLRQKRDVLAGLGLALTAVRPHIALLLALPFLFRRRAVFWGFCLAMLGLAAISLLSVGISGLEAYGRILLTTAGGQGYGIHEGAMVNLVGLLTRLFPSGGSGIRWIGWGIYAAGIVALCLVWARNRLITEKHFGLAVTLAIFVVPHLHYHDLVLLLVPIACLISLLKREKLLGDPIVSLFPLGVSWILMISNSLDVLKYSVPYLVLIFLVLVLGFPGILSRTRLPPGGNSV